MKQFILSVLVVTAVVLSSCKDEEAAPAPININFESTELGISDASPEVEVTVVFSRSTETAGALTLDVNSGNLSYGEDADFYTSLTGTSELSLDYEAGVESVSFVVAAGSALNIEKDESVSLTIAEANVEEFLIGQNATVSITFGENFIAESGQVTLDAGGPGFTNQAFFDFSKNTQTAVDKYSWDLGFYAGSENNVVVNNAAFVMARPLDKSDLAEVSAADTLGFGAVLSVPNFDPSAGAADWIDDQSGDLSATAFGEIATSSEDAKVFIIKRDGEGRNWKKVRVYTSANGYTVEYADIDAEDFTTTEITKDDTFNFNHFDLDNGEVSVEPAKASWDIMYSTYALRYPFGAAAIPYGFNDFITINRSDVSVAVVMTEEANVTYEDFSAAQASDLEFNADQNALGSSWRGGGGPGSAPAVFEDRFFVLKDAQDNYYKIQFLSLTNTDGERGYTDLRFEIL